MEWERLPAEIPSRLRTWAMAGAKAEGGAAGTQQEGAQKGPLRYSGGCYQLGALEHPMDKPHRREGWVEVSTGHWGPAPDSLLASLVSDRICYNGAEKNLAIVQAGKASDFPRGRFSMTLPLIFSMMML